MRGLSLLLAGAALASCTTAPDTTQRNGDRQRELQTLLAGKTAAAPVSCLPNYNSNDMRIIDGRNVAFRLGGRSVYLMHLSPGCDLLGSGNYALLTKQFGGMGYCRGDIVRVFDPTSRITVGSCGIEAIVPYTVSGRY
ncbi:MAG: DUF6491 family protein [Sphingomicrobium sp.]